jgi:hypothetical protein
MRERLLRIQHEFLRALHALLGDKCHRRITKRSAKHPREVTDTEIYQYRELSGFHSCPQVRIDIDEEATLLPGRKVPPRILHLRGASGIWLRFAQQRGGTRDACPSGVVIAL